METTLFRQDPDSWLTSDIAIEVIGRMVAEQMNLLYGLLNEFKSAGFESDAEHVLTDSQYQEYTRRLNELNGEIDDIYRGVNKQAIFDRVEQTYAPYIKNKYAKSVAYGA